MKFQEYEKYASKFTAIPVSRRVLADLLTPVSAYMRLAAQFDLIFLLESVEGGKQYARYSYICLNPRLALGSSAYSGLGDIPYEVREGSDLLSGMKSIIGEYQVPNIPDTPDFGGGFVGILGYESIRFYEDIPTYKPDVNDKNIPDGLFLLFETIMAFDRLRNEIIITHTALIDPQHSLREQYDASLVIVDAVGAALHADIDYQTLPAAGDGIISSNFTKPEFVNAVEQAQEYIRRGDVFQLVLSQRFSRKTAADTLTIYRALRNINPSPYMFLFSLPEYAVIGASPELLVRVSEGIMEVRPIAGTRPRGTDAADDDRLAEDLLSDEKERAEHLMLVDLGRNDVGRVAELGSVRLEEFMVVERYSHVMHIISDVRGTLASHHHPLDALLAGFPAGTVTGAPKIRAMELIHELEPDRRGVYSGAIGYIDFHGNLNTCIAIRTLCWHDGQVDFQSGAGIVADSIPEQEYEETVSKARAIMSAVDFAERGLQ